MVSYIQALEDWRNEDQSDSLTLSRHEVIELIEEIKLLREMVDAYRFAARRSGMGGEVST